MAQQNLRHSLPGAQAQDITIRLYSDVCLLFYDTTLMLRERPDLFLASDDIWTSPAPLFATAPSSTVYSNMVN